MAKAPITCHVLDTSTGKPAAGIVIQLQSVRITMNGPEVIKTLVIETTDDDGRCNLLSREVKPPNGRELNKGELYKIAFFTKSYFQRMGKECFHPWVDITFEIHDPKEHYHVPLLISPFGFTTYRGS